jgi:hypothetical protein
MALALPGAVVVEREFGVPPERVWELVSDLERTVPMIQPHVRRLRVAGEGERLDVRVRGHAGLRARMRTVLRPGWCVMQSRFLTVGMAVEETAEGARFARLQNLRLPGARALDPMVRSTLEAELDRLGRLL